MYQGAALYAYNDAQFTDKDWKGIRMLQDSVKEKDPLKVGRFGLGFKSVLHMTGIESAFSSLDTPVHLNEVVFLLEKCVDQ